MNLITTSSPHIRGGGRTDRIMKDVLIALLPTSITGIFFFGIRALLVILVSVLSAVAGELLWRMVTKKENTVLDCSAAVTGLLLALTLPVSVPYWAAAAGSLFAVIVVKGMCGGLGQNSFNPALGGRAFLMLICPVYVTRFLEAGTKLFVSVPADAVSGATPLHDMVMNTMPESSLMDMFLGNIGGCIGEVSAAALLIGGAYLVVRKVITVRIPLAYIGTIAVLSMIFCKGNNPVEWMLYSVLGGGVLLGGIFMLTDYSSSPVTPKGQILYGVGAGILTVWFRYKGIFPEGVTYAILLMNALAWVIDEKTVPRRFGVQKGGAK
ncbi:MAG: RnfABCDGE type electron transport complex subunit D [Schaedlerella sp.]|nr:RnfABCDGE type electron transport complex subunit D [Schaedlerella sp.]